MKSVLSIIAASMLFIMGFAETAGATVIYVSGDQAGTWSADTVIVTGEVRVPPGQSLTIVPGVEVLFSVYCKLIVDSAATLRAVGTPADSIRFDALLPDSSWHGIRFLSASDSSRLEYCHLTHGLATGSGEDCNGGAIYCSSSSPTISYNTISGNSAHYDSTGTAKGGAIYCLSSSPAIFNNTISENSTCISGWGGDCYGGGIYCSNSNPIISNNTISRNSAYHAWPFGILGCGGAIYCGNNSSPIISDNSITGNVTNDGGGICCGNNSNPIISDNTISGNSTAGEGSSGGGIWCWDSNPIISGNTISGNTAGEGGGIFCQNNSSPTIIGNTISGNLATAFIGCGGGIWCANSSPTISHNTISENWAYGVDSYGGGIYFESSNSIIIGNTISGNWAYGEVDSYGGGIYYNSSSLTLVNCILWGNSPQQIYLQSGGNLQATYCDIQDTLWSGEGNVSVDPLFVDTTNGDYHLQSTVGSFHGGSWLPDSLYSPCIDAGDPGSPFALEPMPNGGRVNMGFEGNTLEASLSTSSGVPLPIAELPREFCLHAPYPNPFNPSTTISFALTTAAPVTLVVYDILGRQVATVAEGLMGVGIHKVNFDGSSLSSGIYFCRLQTDRFSAVNKMVLLK